jgi:Cu(I)/Ag(I) efflux system membrane protein CusA/SilA
MEAAEGKLFKPLAFTKTFALIASVVVALNIIPPFAQILFTGRMGSERLKLLIYSALVVLGGIVSFTLFWWLGVIITLIGGYNLVERWLPQNITGHITWGANLLVVLAVAILLAEHWMPLGPEKGVIVNFIFTALLIGGLLALFYLFMHWYLPLLKWC